MPLTTFPLLPEQFDDHAQGAPATLMGWGLNETGGTIQNVLQEVDLIVFSDEECLRRHAGGSFLPNTANICAGTPNGGKGQCTVTIFNFQFHKITKHLFFREILVAH